MHQALPEYSEHQIQYTDTHSTSSSSQYGSLHHGTSSLHRVRSGDSTGSDSSRRAAGSRRDSAEGVDANQLDEKLRGLRLGSRPGNRRPLPGQRIIDHENASSPPTPRQPLGFKVTKRLDTQSGGMSLTDLPNEILTHVLSHLHPDSHASVALVSKRFYALVTTPHAWRMAFLRYFPGHSLLENKNGKASIDLWGEPSSDVVRSETRHFSRLTPLATWRSEYLFRTRLLRSLGRGKPGSGAGGIGAPNRGAQLGKKRGAVLTYNSKLPWLVTNIHAVFSNGKKPPRAIQGAGDLGVATVSDPTSGKIEKWGLEDSFTASQLEEVAPGLVPYGLGEGHTAIPNVMDVSQPYGCLSCEGFPGGRAYYRGANEMTGRYLDAETGVVDTYPDIPKIPEMSDAICSAWIAKSSGVPATTQSLCGMLTGSALGVVTSYAMGADSSGPHYSNGEMSMRWVLSPGVPIIALKIDDSYSVKRKLSKRVWAVALNALGEVYYLTDAATPPVNRTKGEDATKNAWHTGRSVYWHLLEDTRRAARPDDMDKNALRGAYSPRSSSSSNNLTTSQLAGEAREIEKFLRHKPAHFRKVCEGWDMQRRLEVDFANDDGQGAGESIFVIDCGVDEHASARVKRYTRSVMPRQSRVIDASTTTQTPAPPSLFGAGVAGSVAAGLQSPTASEAQSPVPPPPPTPQSPASLAGGLHEWEGQTFDLGVYHNAVITASALDCSLYSQLTTAEDPLNAANLSSTSSATRPHHSEGEIPGRRARWLAIGTNSGGLVVWNAREQDRASCTSPVRIIQTDSPQISSIAVTALYLVHGGNDGLVQAWDPLASTTELIRTINARSNGRVPRHMIAMNPTLREGNYSAVGAIFLDPDPTVLRGVVSFGAFMRYWTYSSTGHVAGRKRRHRHSDYHGRVASRRLGGTVAGYIATEEAELRRENEQRAREQTRLQKRFGVGALGDLTEEEAMRYAQMMSEEAFLLDEKRRASDSTADASLDTASSYSETTNDTITPEPSIVESSPPPNYLTTDDEEDYERQIQKAIQLSLLEGVNDLGQSPKGNSSGEFDFAIKYRSKGKKAKHSGPSSPSASHALAADGVNAAGPSTQTANEDEDLALALSLSMQDQHQPNETWPSELAGGEQREAFPALDSEGVGKGKGVKRW